MIRKVKRIFLLAMVFMLVSISAVYGASETYSVPKDDNNEYYIGKHKAVQHEEYKGSLQMAQLGLVMKGDTHTNSRLVNGYRDGNRVDTVDRFNVKNKTVYGAFTVYGTKYAAYTGPAVENIGGGIFVTTHHSWSGSKVVSNGIKLYKTLSFTDSTWKSTIATGNYYGKPGSQLIQEKSGNLSDAAKKAINSPQKIMFVFGDNYGGSSSYMVAHDLFIEDNPHEVEEKYYIDNYQVVQHEEYKGSLQMAQLGLVMKGDTHTNSRLVNGYRDGNRVDTVNRFNVKNKTVYGAFTVYGTKYAAYTGPAVENIGGGIFVTTHNSWSGSKVVANGIKLYKTLSFTDSTWKSTIATGNYYGKPGSQLIQEKSGNLSDAAKKAINSPQKIMFVFGDNYGGSSSYMVAHDLFIEDNPHEVEEKYYIDNYQVVQHKEYKGSLQMAQLGLVMKGDTHTNSRLVNGYRDGNRVDTVNRFNVKNKTVYGAFTVYGTKYAAYTGPAVENIGGGIFVTTHNSWSGSKVVYNGTKLYKTLSFTDSTWKSTIATGNYYGKPGSQLIQEKSGNLSDAAKKAINSPQKIMFVFGDNYGGSSSYMVAHDLFIEDNPYEVEPENNLYIDIDTASSWAVPEIREAVSKNLTTTKATNNFKGYITREEFCEVIMKFYDAVGGKTITNMSNPFNDTNNSEIIRAYNAKIVGGTTETTFSPHNNLTREQLCVMLVRALDAAGVSYSQNVDFKQNYSDKSFLSSWAYDSVKLLNGYNIFNGTGNELDPRGTVTKEVAIVLVKRVFDRFKK